MSRPAGNQLENDVKAIVQQHLALVAEYMTSIRPDDIMLCETIRDELALLDNLIQTPADYADHESYLMATRLLDRIRQLFRLINPAVNSDEFQESELGKLWIRANDWCNRLNTHYDVSDEEVWHLIAPAVPDVLKRLRMNLYEAFWWKPVPQMDIEILQRTEHVVIENPPFEAPNLPGLVSVRFSIQR